MRLSKYQTGWVEGGEHIPPHPSPLVRLVLVVATILVMVATHWVAFQLGSGTDPDPLLQSSFPCQEDEVLGFTPQSTTHLTCIPWDQG